MVRYLTKREVRVSLLQSPVHDHGIGRLASACGRIQLPNNGGRRAPIMQHEPADDDGAGR
jgi:hypothetical protein